jgi:hypothetical protein
MKEITYSNDKLFIEDKMIDVADFIQKLLLFQSRIVVLTKNDQLKDDQNIYCYDESGILIWKIPACDKLNSANDYTNIYLDDDNLMAYCRNGIEVTVDVNTGLFLKEELVK